MEIVSPDCVFSRWQPCGESDWRQCARCAKWICEIHVEELLAVRHSGTNPDRGVDWLCSDCVQAGFEAGEISTGGEFEYINRR